MIITPWLRHAVVSTLMGFWYGLCPTVLTNMSIWIGVGKEPQHLFSMPYVYINTVVATYIYYFFAPYLYWQFAQDEFRNPHFQWKIGIGNYLLLTVCYAYGIFFFTEVSAMTIGLYPEYILHRSILVVASSSCITILLEFSGLYSRIRVLYLMGELTE
jgi:hypothetical protein